MGCIEVVEEVLEILGYGRCESYWGSVRVVRDL